jgi:hypothetical protein
MPVVLPRSRLFAKASRYTQVGMVSVFAVYHIIHMSKDLI